MPVLYIIDASEKLIRTRCVGYVTFSEVIDHFQTLVQDPLCPDHLDVLLDLSETTSLPESDQLATVAHEIRRIQMRVQFGACAIVASREALFGMLRMFEVMVQPYFRATQVFRVASEAEIWLKAQRLSAARP